MTSPDAGYAVRLANAGDIAAVAGARARWREHEADDAFVGEFERWWLETEDRRRTWIALGSQRIIGMVSMTVFTRMPSPGEPGKQWAYVGQVWVDPAYRRMGIAHTTRDKNSAIRRIPQDFQAGIPSRLDMRTNGSWDS